MQRLPPKVFIIILILLLLLVFLLFQFGNFFKIVQLMRLQNSKFNIQYSIFKIEDKSRLLSSKKKIRWNFKTNQAIFK